MTPAAGLAVIPVLAACLLAVLHAPRVRHWVEQGACLLTLLVAILLPWLADGTDQPSASLFAMLFACGALADAVSTPGRHRLAQAAAQLRLAALLLALLPFHPLLSLLCLAVASAAGAATKLPRLAAVVGRLSAANAALGLALFGEVAMLAGAMPIGGSAVLIAWGILATLDRALLPLVLLLALRLQVGAGPETHIGALMVVGGLCLLLGSAVTLLRRPAARRLPELLTLAQGGLALCAFGLGGPDLRFAGLVHLALLVLSRAAAMLSNAAGLDRLAAIVGLAGLPPLGMFPSLALILAGMAVQAPLLLMPVGAGLLVLAWAALIRVPGVGPRPAGRIAVGLSPAWVPFAACVALGLAMPAPVADWFRTLAAAAP